jgi:hypothetical protein
MKGSNSETIARVPSDITLSDAQEHVQPLHNAVETSMRAENRPKTSGHNAFQILAQPLTMQTRDDSTVSSRVTVISTMITSDPLQGKDRLTLDQSL